MEAGREKQLSNITSLLLPSVTSATFLPQTWGEGEKEGTLMLPPHACPSDLEGLSLACSFETGCSHQETREA